MLILLTCYSMDSRFHLNFFQILSGIKTRGVIEHGEQLSIEGLLFFVVHFSVENHALTKTLAIHIFYFQTAEWAFPFLNFVRAGQAFGFLLGFPTTREV
jgi:hypothetical protein